MGGNLQSLQQETRSSAQGNCSAKSLVPQPLQVTFLFVCVLGGVPGGYGGGGTGGAGDISSTLPYTALPHGACPKGTSHNQCSKLCPANKIWKVRCCEEIVFISQNVSSPKLSNQSPAVLQRNFQDGVQILHAILQTATKWKIFYLLPRNSKMK